MIRSIVEQLGSKRLLAALTAMFFILFTFAGGIVARKTGIQLSATDILLAAGLVASPIVAFIVSQWHIDVASKGATTTAFAIASKATKVIEGIVAAKVPVLAQVLKVVEDATAAADASQALTPVVPVPAIVPPAVAAPSNPSPPPAG